VSGLNQLTVNQPLRQRWFESITTHQYYGTVAQLVAQLNYGGITQLVRVMVF
jgi:hypothetical protein